MDIYDCDTIGDFFWYYIDGDAGEPVHVTIDKGDSRIIDLKLPAGTSLDDCKRAAADALAAKLTEWQSQVASFRAALRG